MKKNNLFLLFVMLTGLFFQPVGTAQAMGTFPGAASDGLAPAEEMINPDGSLRLDGNFSGALDLSGWDVTLDPALGPVLSTRQLETDHPSPAAVATGHWTSLGSDGFLSGSLNNSVTSIAVSGSDVYVGGFFTDVNNNGTSIPEADYIAKWDGSNWSPLGTNGFGNGSLNNWVGSIAISGTEIYVGGKFTNVTNSDGTSIPEADYIAKYDTTTGQWSALGNNGSGNGSLNNFVDAIGIHETGVYVGGSFYDVNNYGSVIYEADSIARYDLFTGQWYALGSNGAGGGSLNGDVYTIAIAGDDIFAGGIFNNVNNNGTVLTAGDYIARWSISGSYWDALGQDGAGNGSLNDTVNSIAVQNQTVYVGGHFLNVKNRDGSTLDAADYVAAYDLGADNWAALGQDGLGGGTLNGVVRTVVVIGNMLYAGGSFNSITDYGNTLWEADYIARWDGSNWSALSGNGAGNGSLDFPVEVIALDGDTLYAGGEFTAVNDNGVLIPQAAYVAAYGADNPPVVTSIKRADANPTSKNNVNFDVTFSETVFNVDVADFAFVSPGLTGAMVMDAVGFGKNYVVSIYTGTGNGSFRLALFDNDTILDASGNPLGGTGLNNGDYWIGETYTVKKQLTLRSQGAYDGWTLEKGEYANIGGTLNKTATTLRLGDDAARRQYRSILSFSTKGLPDNAVITKVLLKVKRQGIVGGGNPVTLFGGIYADMRRGFLGSSAGLQLSDFQAKYTTLYKTYGVFKPGVVSGWYTINLTNGKAYINKWASSGGVTQIRLRFKLDDNNNSVANFLSLYSGNAPLASRPKLIIQYYVP